MNAVRPNNYISNSVWSNFDGVLDLEVEERLRMGDCYAHHTAWDYCGSVWFDPSTETWYEEIWQYGSPIAIITGDSATNVIAQALAGYGVR